MANNKVELSDGTVLLDLTADTVTADAVIAGRSLHLANGESATGTLEFPVTSVNSKTGAVSLTASDVGAAATSHTHTIANVTNLQTTLDGKQATVTGAATTITSSNLTANRALIANSSGKVVVSDVTSTELSYLDGVTSNIQTQLNKKIESAPVTSVNSKTGAVTISASDISAVPTSRTVNGKALTANISLAASDIGALSAAAGSVERANLAANATESETTFNSSTSFSSLVSYRGKTLALNAGSSSNVSITVAGADTAYATGFEVAILPQDVQSATIRFTSGTICAAGLTGVLDASSSAVELTLEKYVAIGLKKLNSGLWFITGEWENYEDTTKGEKGMIYVMSGGGNGCMLEVTGGNAGDSLLVVNSQLGKSYSRTFNSNKIVKINGMQSGDWALTMTSKDGTQTKSATIHIDADYLLTMAYFSATINVTYPEGSTCTATDGTTTLSAPDTSGTWMCIVPNAGTWTVTATDGTQTKSLAVSITAEGQVETVELSYALYLLKDGVLGTGTDGQQLVFETVSSRGAAFANGLIYNSKGTSTGTANVPWRFTPTISTEGYSTLKFSIKITRVVSGYPYKIVLSKTAYAQGVSGADKNYVVAQTSAGTTTSDDYVPYSIDVSAIQGDYYLNGEGSGEFYIDKIWLE